MQTVSKEMMENKKGKFQEYTPSTIETLRSSFLLLYFVIPGSNVDSANTISGYDLIKWHNWGRSSLV